jgi:hypothetical protein
VFHHTLLCAAIAKASGRYTRHSPLKPNQQWPV